MSAPERVVLPEVMAPERLGRAPTGGPLLVAAAGIVAAVCWLVVRPDAPGGVAAVVDMLVLPAVLFVEIRVLAGRTTLPPKLLAALFGSGAVFAVVTAVVLQRAAGAVGGRSAIHAVGPLVEAVALSAPLLVVALLAGGRRFSVADMALAGLTTGLGFLVVQATLVTAAIHAAPDYQSPLLAGMQGVPTSAGSPPVYFVGNALGTALIGLAVGVGLRLRAGPVRFLPAGLALSLVVFDHGLFTWRLRHLVAFEAAYASGPVDVAQRLALDGRLALVLLVGGLVTARLIDGGRGRRLAGTTVDLRDDLPGDDAAEPEPPPVPSSPDDGPAGEAVAPDGVREPRPGGGPAWAFPTALVAAVVCGVALTAAARSRHLGILDSRPLALVVSLAGLAYSLWHLPAGLGRRAGPALRHLLAVSAVASSGLGVLCAVLPTPRAAVPVHGGLILDTVVGWGARVGNLGFVLGLGGLAAPPGGHGNRRFGDRWSGLVLRRLRWAGWFGTDRSKGPAGGRHERDSWSGGDRRRRWRQGLEPVGGAPFWWARLRGGGWMGRRSRHADATLARSGAMQEGASAIAIEPVYRAALSHREFAGETVKDAMEAAMRTLGVDLAHSSLQLVDEGGPAKPGKPGTGRPARVRVSEAGDGAAQALVPPSRDSITRDTPFVVVVEVAGDHDSEPPESLNVTLRATHAHRSHTRTLACARLESPPERSRYRSNPFSADAGEDTTWARTSSGTAPVPAGGFRVDSGGVITVHHRGERAAIAVYDGWAQQVVAVNRWLLDLTEEHHVCAGVELEERLAQMEDSGDEADGVRRRVQRLQARLHGIEECRRVLSAPRTADPTTHDCSRAFESTALLHAAMTVEDHKDTDGGVAGGKSYRLGVAGELSEAEAAVNYRDFLNRTVVGLLWERGAYSGDDVARLLGWERFTDEDPADVPVLGRSAPAPIAPERAQVPPEQPADGLPVDG